MKRWFCLAALVLLVGCAKPARISTNLDIKTMPPGLTVVILKIKNLENRATTPLAIDLNIQMRQGGEWSKPDSVIHPQAFVLNRHEEQILRATVKSTGDAVRASLTVKEQENGRTILKQQSEKTL